MHYGGALQSSEGISSRAVRWREVGGEWLPEELGNPLDLHSSVAHGVNGSGAIVGVSFTPNSASLAWRWSEGVVTALPEVAGATNTAARAINSAGTIVGNSDFFGTDAAGLQVVRQSPVVWRNGVLTELATPAGYRCQAVDINESDVIIGVCKQTAAAFLDRGVVWRDGQPTLLEPLSEDGPNAEAFASGVNDQGHIVGSISDLVTRAVIWENDTPIDLGGPSGCNGRATELNDNGQIVGVTTCGPTLWTLNPPVP